MLRGKVDKETFSQRLRSLLDQVPDITGKTVDILYKPSILEKNQLHIKKSWELFGKKHNLLQLEGDSAVDIDVEDTCGCGRRWCFTYHPKWNNVHAGATAFATAHRYLPERTIMRFTYNASRRVLIINIPPPPPPPPKLPQPALAPPELPAPPELAPQELATPIQVMVAASSSKPLKVVISGAPGSGEGTQSELVAARIRFPLFLLFSVEISPIDTVHFSASLIC